MIPQCTDQGVALTPYSPLARGYLAGTHTRDGQRHTTRAAADPVNDSQYGRPVDFDIIDRVIEIARDRGVAPAQIALAWCLRKPWITAPIIGATRIQHIDDAIAATNLELTTAEVAALEHPYKPRNVID